MVMIPALVLMTGLTAIYLRTRESPVAQGAMAAVKPAVVGLLAWIAFKIGTQSIEGLGSLAIGGLAFAALTLRVHPALVMCGAMLMGALMMRPST
jgi:chromate transport protein ChrA